MIGVVKKVECDRKNDIFDGLLLSTPHGDRYVLGEQVTAVHEDAVEASITTEQLTKAEASPTLEPHGITHYISWGELRHWIAIRLGVSHLDDPRLDEAEARLRSRERAQRLARENPSLALEAGIGRPDIRVAFHGEVIDVNNAGAGRRRVLIPGGHGARPRPERSRLRRSRSPTECTRRDGSSRKGRMRAPHAATIQARHPPVSRRSRLTATPPDPNRAPPRGSILNRHLVSSQPAPASERFDATATAITRSGKVLTGAVG